MNWRAPLYLPLLLHVLLLSVIPLGLLFLGAVSPTPDGALRSVEFDLSHFGELFGDLYYLANLGYTLVLSLTVAAATVLCAVPFTFLLTALKGRWRNLWLVTLLSSLALSEVLAVYAWQIMLSPGSGLPAWLHSLGMLDPDVSWWPGRPAMIVVMVYFALPVAIIVLYAPVALLDTRLADAGRTMGLQPATVFRLIQWPLLRGPVLRAFVLTLLLTLGSFVIAQQLGRPSDWTFPVLIADFMRNFDIGLGVSGALLLLISAGLLVALLLLPGSIASVSGSGGTSDAR